MTFSMLPGSVLGCEMNAHRHNWNGTVCQSASTWNCHRTPNLDFRRDYCEQGDARCFSIHTFAPGDPYLVMESKGAGWILEDDPTALNDQILLLWGQYAAEPRGIREGATSEAVVYGAYRVRAVEPRARGAHTQWVVRPHADGWARMSSLRVPSPRFESLRGPYIKQVARSAFERLLEIARHTNASDPSRALPPEDRRRLDHFLAHATKWLDEAARLAQRHAPRPDAVSAAVVRGTFASTPLKDIGKQITALAQPAVVTARPAAVPVDEGPGGQLVEPGRAAEIEKLYGPQTLTALRVASLTKPLIILRGNPGVGKSTLAGRLLDDPDRERTLIIAVTSTWRGREDLLGYVNPIDGLFVPTEFTRFLLRSEAAWKENRRQPRVVVFEEFNLSQPEYWLSDVLVRSQLEGRDRHIELGGNGLSGSRERATSVFLSPAIRFVATINADHTGRPISPRVLDRAAVVDIEMEPRRALDSLGVSLDADQISALEELDFLLRDKGAAFSLRTAKSLRRCIDRRGELGLDSWAALDLVLLQELLTKVRLLAVDPGDQQLAGKLVEWSEGVGQRLVLCSREVESWRDLLQSNRDVQKA